MANKVLPIICKIVESNVEVGAGKRDTNTIVIQVTNTSAEPITFSGPGARGEFSMAISIGRGSENLVATSEESTAITIQAPSQWRTNSYKNLDGQATWSYRLPRAVLQGEEAVQLKLTKFESHTDPGKAKITISAKIHRYDNFETTLEIEKETKEFALLYFTADPPYLITEEDKDNFELRWDTVKAKRAVLYSYNDVRIKEFQEGKEFDKGSDKKWQNEKSFTYDNERPSLNTTYKLVVTDEADENNTKEEKLKVQVLKPGWYPVKFRFGYPAVLCSMDGSKLYGIFIKQGKAALYASEYPYAGWTLINDEVPDGMETSPAVSFHNKLWLVGGSTANPDIRNNDIWCYESDPGEWKKQAAPWTARMGHACVVFRNKLWVMGGNDETGTSVNDIWAAELHGEQLEWTEKPTAPWKQPRCMFAATVFNNEKIAETPQIWIYGGVTAPFSDPLDDMWFSEDGESWTKYTKIPKDNNKPIGKPIGSTLQVIQDKLNLLGSFRSGTNVTFSKFILNVGQELWDSSVLGQHWDGQGGNTYSLLSVEHKGLIFLRSLDYQTRDNPTQLYLYVP
jgi:hypothetical protein